MWDAPWDQQNIIKGKVYSDHIADIISRIPATRGPFPRTSANSTPGSITPSPGGGGGVNAGDLTRLAGLLQLFCLTYFSL